MTDLETLGLRIDANGYIVDTRATADLQKVADLPRRAKRLQRELRPHKRRGDRFRGGPWWELRQRGRKS